MIDGHEVDGQGQRRFARGDDEHQHVRPGLRGAIGRDDGFAFRLLVFIQRLDDQKLHTFQAGILLGSNERADHFSELQVFYTIKLIYR